MTTQARGSKGLWTFFVLTYAMMLLTWGVMALLQIPGASAASGTGSSGVGGLVLLFLGGFSPSIAGMVMTWRVGGRDGLRDLFKRAAQVKLGWRWYLALLLLPLLIVGLRVGIHVARAGTFVQSPLLMRPLSLISFTIPLILVGPLSEEFGWRGFALDRLLTRWDFVRVSLLMGVVLAFWHLPLFFVPGTIQQTHGNPVVEFPLFAVQIMGLTVLFNWVYIKTHRSLFAAILVHFVVNWLYTFSGTVMNGGTLDRFVNAIAYAAFAGLILIWWKPGSGTIQRRLDRAMAGIHTINRDNAYETSDA